MLPLREFQRRPQRVTDREAEIARLAANGLPSKEIAGQLGRSPRTVDNTLRGVYAKLGIRSRRDLAGALSAA